jgi:hypothetical protein
MHRIKWGILLNHFVPTASDICGVKTEHSGRKQIQFPKRCPLCFLEYWTMQEAQQFCVLYSITRTLYNIIN